MSVYMIVCLPERGGYYPTFALAHALKAHGHSVIYPGLADFQEDVERQGFTFLAMFPGSPSFDPSVGEVPHSLVKKLLYLRRKSASDPRRFQIVEAIANGELEALMKTHHVDVVLLDAFLQQLAPVCRNANVRLVSMATELMNYQNYAIPPNCSLYPPSGSAGSRLITHALWGKHFLLVYLRKLAFSLVTTLLLWPRPPRELRRRLKALRTSVRLSSMFSEYSWRFVLPEIVLCPQAFDFPIARAAAGRRYLGVTIDRRRADVPFPHPIPPDKKLVYASLGTHAAMYGATVDRFVRCLIEVARSRPGYHFVVNIGKGNIRDKFPDPPDNVLLTHFVPQLQILDRSAAIITNGGLGTVKEAIMAEVPLLVLPCRWDQFGNAARVKFHGLGDYCKINKLTAPQLQQRLDRLLDDRACRTRLARMKKQIEHDDEFARGVRWLTTLATLDTTHSQ